MTGAYYLALAAFYVLLAVAVAVRLRLRALVAFPLAASGWLALLAATPPYAPASTLFQLLGAAIVGCTALSEILSGGARR